MTDHEAKLERSYPKNSPKNLIALKVTLKLYDSKMQPNE